MLEFIISDTGLNSREGRALIWEVLCKLNRECLLAIVDNC